MIRPKSLKNVPPAQSRLPYVMNCPGKEEHNLLNFDEISNLRPEQSFSVSNVSGNMMSGQHIANSKEENKIKINAYNPRNMYKK